MAPSEVWALIDKLARVTCSHAAQGKACTGNHPQGKPVVYGYETLTKRVESGLQAARNTALDQAIGEVSGLATENGSVLKSNVLEILNSLKK